jgi:hypothetical protein
MLLENGKRKRKNTHKYARDNMKKKKEWRQGIHAKETSIKRESIMVSAMKCKNKKRTSCLLLNMFLSLSL